MMSAARGAMPSSLTPSTTPPTKNMRLSRVGRWALRPD
jgi:hypothetical protein